MKLDGFNLSYHHMPRREMAVADGLSRFNQLATNLEYLAKDCGAEDFHG
jgi:hypothetical protein